ncbi:MAG: MATE family efflux transporter, partial [Saprospiraceae bacterium]|nr:MATE family efflux transporter [Saprospiraceae bacterium]
IRNIYLILSIPCWGYSAGINTLVSNFIGNRKRQAVVPIIWKTAKMNLWNTLFIAVPVTFFPEFFLYPLFGSEDMSLINEAKHLMPVLVMILVVFSFGSIFINGLTGTGHTKTALWIQSIFVAFYIIYTVLVIKYLEKGLIWAWGVEIFYWLGILFVSYWYLKSNKWHTHRF